MKVHFLFVVIFLLAGTPLLQSCGKAGSSADLEWEPRAIEQEAQGAYMGVLNSLNNDAGGPISGSVTLKRDENTILAFVRFSGGQPGVVHQQKIHAGTTCPGPEQDSNGDGWVDVNESFAHTQGTLIPLDGDISSQARGMSLWSAGDQYGYYWYEKSASYNKFIADLRTADSNSSDELVKLDSDGMLNLDSRVVIIYGVAPEISLPTTVGTRGRRSSHQTLPIACAVIRKVSTVPGSVENDPGTVLSAGTADVNGGGDGSDDGATVPVGTGGAAGGGTIGEEDEDDDGWRWPWEDESDGDIWPWGPVG